jgi:hypothetical protein
MNENSTAQGRHMMGTNEPHMQSHSVTRTERQKNEQGASENAKTEQTSHAKQAHAPERQRRQSASAANSSANSGVCLPAGMRTQNV